MADFIWQLERGRITFAGEPGKTVSHTFTADTACTCVIEIEDTSTEIGSLVVSP